MISFEGTNILQKPGGKKQNLDREYDRLELKLDKARYGKKTMEQENEHDQENDNTKREGMDRPCFHIVIFRLFTSNIK